MPKSIVLEADVYKKALFDFEVPTVSFNNITMDERLSTTTTKSVTKRGLNALYMKMHVHDNLVSISPLKRNGEFL